MGLKQTTQCLGYEQITSVSSAKGLTVPQGATFIRLVCTTQAIRWRDDGIAPTATVGMPLAVDTELQYDGDLQNIQFIEQTAGTVINVSYYN